MKIISLMEIVECNAYLKAQNLNFRIHIRDACGRQSCWIEPPSDDGGEGTYEAMYHAVNTFFEKIGFSLEYDDKKLNFWVDQSK